MFVIVVSCKTEDLREINFPSERKEINEKPDKDKLWIFVLAGQSNMAGRGFVEPIDTVANNRIIHFNKNKEWVYAKEPLHFYEANLTGLDCGLSFANELLQCIPDSITIGLIPCAVGGSSISQWLNDDLYRDVKLFTNFKERVESVEDQGIFKGILWHQGESDGNSEAIPLYKDKVTELFGRFRETMKNDSLPILVAELGAFMKPLETQEKWDSINVIIHESANMDENRYIISTKDLSHKGDNLHFDSKSQREMGTRFANKYCEL